MRYIVDVLANGFIEVVNVFNGQFGIFDANGVHMYGEILDIPRSL
jgi:hypothetical protein